MEESEKADSETIPTNDDASPSQGKSCALCGCATPAVRCDRCNSQIFCLSCDDMYHRHPKRKLHLRKAVDSIWTTARSPRLRRRTELPGDPCKIPIPPPRSKKREHRTIGGRTFLKSGLELGSFGHSKIFSPASKDFFAGQKSPASMVESNCDDGTPSPNIRGESGQIYENDNITNATGNIDDRSPWNPRPNISSPIQVSIPSSSPDIVANGQPFGYPTKPHSQSAADLTTHTGHHAVGHHPYHFHPPYPYMHPPVHPYSHSMAHLNCAQCISSSWSNLVSPHPSPYFHPMPWGSAQNTLSRPPVPGQPGPTKHSHGDLSSYPEPGFHYPYPGAPYYHNAPPVVDPNFIKDLHEQAEMQKQRKDAKSSPRNEEMDIATNPSPMAAESSSNPGAAESTEPVASPAQDAQPIDEIPVAPQKPTEPWSCAHCTFINPPGIYICQVCCKTSYGNRSSEAAEEQSEDRPESRDTDSPLINRDALMNSPGLAEMRDAQKDIDVPDTTQLSDFEWKEEKTSTEILSAPIRLTTETQTFTTTKTTDVQTQNITRKSIASSTDSIFPRQEISVQTEIEAMTKYSTVATDPMISSQSLESLLSGVSAPPYHNRRAGWGRGATSFSTQSLYERGRSRSPMPRSLSFHTETPAFGRDSSFASEEAMHSASQAWLYSDPMYYKPHNRVLEQSPAKEDYFDGTWGSMDRLNHRVKHKKDKEKLDVRPKFHHRSLDDLKSEKKPEFIHTHELMMLQTVKEAERCGFTLEDLHVAYLHCGKENPVFWLEDNWPQMTKNVIGLAAKYGEENEENDVGAITTTEAKEALRIHRGDIWDAVAECIETRQRKILELTVRGNFTQKQIAETLKNNEGNVELAYADLLRASTKRHKFILSPGLSTDSEDLNVYNPAEDSTADHNVSLSPMKAAKQDASAESKSEKKKSDFLTKLTAIREAQSERRKAREEKELIRETITQDLPIPTETEDVLKEKDISIELTPSISREDSKEVEEILQGGIPESEEVLPESKLEAEVLEAKDVSHTKEVVEDSIPVDFDTNWSESQGEWIEEYSDEHWEEGDEEHWVGLGKKFQKMQKEFEEEAMQMAALWEKEELEDDVFEDETKVQKEEEAVIDSDKKFDEWVKANLKVDSSEYEEEIELKGKLQDENITTASLQERLELEGSQPSPLQHYPTALDLSLKSQFESDWVDLPADAEIEKLAHDIVCEGSDVENKFDETEMVMYEEETHLRKVSDQGSDEDWEKIEMDEQLQEMTELDNFAFPEKEGETDRGAEEEIQDISDKVTELPSEVASEIIIEKDTTVLYKNLESVRAADVSDVGIIETESSTAIDLVSVNDTKKLTDQPKAPIRRRSKLSSTDIEEALKNQSTTEVSADIPPPLPEKVRHKGDQQKVLDIYSVPDKTAKANILEDSIFKEFDKDLPAVPQKPPRLNLSPTLPEKTMLSESEKESEISQKVLTKEGSPLSYESDSNFFADSESDTEIKLHRQKNIHRKLAKYENEFEESETKDISVEKFAKRTIKEKKDVLESPFDLEISEEKLEESITKESDILESNFDLELDEDIDPSLIEPLPRMKDIDYDPELPILLGGRGRQVGDIDDVNAPKAFREGTTRPLQLFKATKKESSFESISMPEPTVAESPTRETSFIQRIADELPMPATTSNIPYGVSTKLSESATAENQINEAFYYNESLIPQQNFVDTQVPQLQTQEQLIRKEEVEKEIESAVQPTPATQEEEMPLTEMEALSAVADYFFGRYNEITVTPPKKKVPARPKPVAPLASKSSSKIMSSSEISPPLHLEDTSHMEQSAAAILQEKSLQEEEKEETTKQNITESAAIKNVPPPQEKPKQPAPTECLSFAEDYLFGCYTQVVPPRKTKNVPVITKIPKLGEALSLSRPQSPLKEQKPSTPIETPEPSQIPIDQEEEEEELVEEEVLEEDENISIRTDTSATYDDVFHDFPPELLSNQSFDESSIYYESFQDAVEDAQNSVIGSSIVNARPKSVHFEEPQTPAVPPRRSKARGPQKTKAPSSTDPTESYANEYLFRQYELGPQAKKKLPFCSKDFRMNQGFEPTEIPSDTSLTPDEEEEEVICSETSVEIPSKSNELFKSSSEYDFRDSEQPLDLIECDTKETELKDSESPVKSDHLTSHPEDNPLLDESSVEVESSSFRQDDIITDIQSEKSESFEELSIPDNLEEMIESSHISEDLYATVKNESLSDHLLSTVTETEVISVQQVQSYDTMSNEASNRLEMDQFVFIEQAQDIIDDSYNLFDIQDSLVCDLNYVDVKGNIEDECTDDSEQEWKRNEDRKNTLNASFLNNTSIKKVTDDQEETLLDEPQQCAEKGNMDDSQTKMEVVLDETQSSDIEKMEHNQEERESTVDQKLEGDFVLTKAIKEDEEFSEQSENVCIEKQFITTEMLDTELNKIAETVESKFSTITTDEFQSTSEDVSYDNEEIFPEEIDENPLEFTQIINEETSFIDDEFQIMSESFENLTEKIDENLLEIEKELSESISYMPLEFDGVTSEELSTVSSISELSDTINMREEITSKFSVEESETGDMTMIEEPSDEAEISDILMKEETELEASKLELKTSEIDDVVKDESTELESAEEETSEVELMDEDKFLSEDQQVYVLEDFEASEELSDDNVSTHSSVSTQIAVSMKITLKESEGDECSLNLEQIDNFEDDYETSLMRPVIAASQKMEDNQYNISDIDIVELTKREEVFDNIYSEEEKHETESIERDSKVESEECRNELTPIPSVLKDICTQETVLEKSISDENFEFSDKVSDYGNIIDGTAEEGKTVSFIECDKLQDHILSSKDSSYTENITPETADNEIKSNELGDDEIEALMAEESIMTHFYDEWYQSEASTKFSFLSAESIYAKYGSTESSESGNESDIDNALKSIDSNAIINETVTDKDESGLSSQILEEDIKDFEYDSEKSLLKKDILHEETECYEIDVSQESVTSDISEIKKEVDMSLELKLKSIEDNQQMYERDSEKYVLSEEIEISSHIQEKTESVILQVSGEVSIESVKEEETSNSIITNNKFSTSKSCQTEDSFEEDIFFDSFDDTFTIPSYIQLPIETQTKPPTTDISIQCELISIDDILSSKKILSISQTEVITADTQIVLAKKDSPEESKLKKEEPKTSELESEEKEESSCESFEDSDSDIFIESPSSQDELDASPKRGLLYAEVDSDTGFSSGSECGWIKKRDHKQKDLKKVSQTSSESKIISLHTSTSATEEKDVTVSVDSSVHDIQEKFADITRISEKRMAVNIVQKDVEILSDNVRSSPFPPEIIERAITPVAIPQFPSFEDDLMFVEVEGADEEITDNVEAEVTTAVSTTPTVEYFYGSLPETVKIESHPDSNERFFETASELSESLSFSTDKTESFSDSTSSLALSEKKSCELNIDNKVASVTKSSEDESFAETLSSLKGETEDSISEYYSFPDSVSLVSRASLAESDIFDYAQSEMFTDDDFIIDSSSNYENKETFVIEKTELHMSEINKVSDVTTITKSDDEHHEKISTVISVTDTEETNISCDISQVIECKESFDDQPHSEKEDEFLSMHETEPSVEIQKSAHEEELIDSKIVLSAEESQIFESTECGSVASSLIKPSTDVPPVPSDIVRYLYYDDSITFDDESFHTQSASAEVPSLTSQDVKLVDSFDNLTTDETKCKISVDGVQLSSSVQATNISEEKVDISRMESENKSKLSDELAEKIVKMDVQEIQETPVILEISEEKIEPTIDKSAESITDLIEKAPEPEVCALENIQSMPETDLKFPSIEVLPSESIAILPTATEQTFETVEYKEESARESIIVSDTLFEEVSSQDNKLQDVTGPTLLKQSSTDIPPVPSDIVRYLYYGDDITFDEMEQNSFHSQFDNDMNELGDVQLPVETAQSSDLKPAITVEPELLQDVADTPLKLSSELPELTDNKPHIIAESDAQYKVSEIYLEESSYKPDSGSTTDEPHVPFDSSEGFEDWFDLKETSDIMKHRDSEQYSSTKSSALKEDSEPPCIPEYILSPKLSADVPIGKNDVDEITDISTHFTMTDDSDRFSDIENDVSLNFEDEYVLPIDVSDHVQLDQLRDEELFESCMRNDDDEMYLNTSEFEDVQDEFEFFIPEPIKVFPEQEKITESIPSELPKDQLKESMIPIELVEQQIHEEVKLELPELKEEINEGDSLQLLKEQSVDSVPLNELSEQPDMKEKIDECITSTSEVSKEEFAECLTSSELVNQKFEKDAQAKEREISDECTEISEISKEQFEECLTPSKLFDEKTVESADEIILESAYKHLPEQLSEYDENGNFPELLVKSDIIPDSMEVKDHISSKILEICPEVGDLESSLAIKSEESEIACVSSEHSVYSEPSPIIPEAEMHSHEELDLNVQQVEVAEAISTDKSDLETSCYTSPIEESHSISTEISDNWSDADARYIEDEESIYDIPIEEINVIHSDTNVIFEESNKKLTVCETDFVNLESVSRELKVTDSKEIDIPVSESLETELKKSDIEITETVNVLDFKSELNETTENLNIQLIENKQSKILHDDSYEYDKISEVNKMLVSDEIMKSVDSTERDIFASESLSEQNLKQSEAFCDSLLSSDMELTHEVKLETESEISSTMKEKIHVECMSTTSDTEPTFSPAEMVHYSQDAQSEKISSEETCLGEEVIKSTLTQAYAGESSSEDKITITAMDKRTHMISDVDILENSGFKSIETKPFEILDSEISDYVSFSDSSKSNELSLNNIALEVKENEIFKLSQEDKNVEEMSQSLVTSSFISPDTANESKLYSISENTKVEGEDIKSIEIVDFKGELSESHGESISKITPFKTISLDKESKEQVCFSKTPEGDTDFDVCKIKPEQNIVESERKYFTSTEQLSADDEKFKTEVSAFSLTTRDDSISKDLMKKDILIETQEPSQTVDFKGFVTSDEDHISFKIKEPTVIVNEEVDSKFTQGKQIVFSSDISIPSEVIDFKGELIIDDVPNKIEADDKSCDKVSVTIDNKESKPGITPESSEIVDFKLITCQDIIEIKEKPDVNFKSDEKFAKSKELDLVLNESEGSFERIDFKGQITNLPESEKTDIVTSVVETKSTIIEKIDTSTESKTVKTGIIQESVPIQKEKIFPKTETFEAYEVVDFKGKLVKSHDTLEPGVKDVEVSITDVKMFGKIETIHKDGTGKLEKIDKLVKSEDSKQTECDTLETVDFKGSLTADELKMQSEKDELRKDLSTIKDSFRDKLESDNVVIESVKEAVDFKGIIDSSSKIDILEKKSEAVTYDSQKTSYSYLEEQDIIVCDPQEMYSSYIDEQAMMFDLRETSGYGYGIDEQGLMLDLQETSGYGFDEQAIICESQQTFQYGNVEESDAFVLQQQSYYDDVIPEPDSYVISAEESSKLCSCVETLSAASDSSLQFQSFSYDPEDTLNISTSEDFTDVPSHLTSTEDSDKWSDVEGDFLLEDAECNRDKTPTRMPYESITSSKEEFKPYADDTQLSKTLIESDEVKVESTIISDNEKLISSASELITTDAKIEKEDSNKREIVSDSDHLKEAEQESFIFDENKKTEVISLLTESTEELKLFTDKEIPDADGLGMVKIVEDVEPLSAETDLSIITASEDITDMTSYISVDDSENLSDVKIENQVGESDICAADAIAQSDKFIPKSVITDHAISDIKTSDIQASEDDTPLMEHFADIKSLKDPLTTVATFSSFDIETAVPKMHEDISSGIPSQSEKTESEHWLEAETEHSISELSEDIAFCIEKDGDTKFIFVDYEKPVEHVATTSEPSGTPHTSTTSTSSSYSDFESSDHTSDTYADISLQGATTESSDKWSDFEAEGLSDDLLNIDIPETVEIADFSQLIRKTSEGKFSADASPFEDNLKATQDFVEVQTENKEVEIITERKSDSLKLSDHDTSVQDTGFPVDDVSDFKQTFSSAEPSSLPSSSASRETVGLSDEEFTDVTPLEITADASDKLSDISDDTSFGETVDESSISLKVNFKAQDQELTAILTESKTDSGSNLQENEMELKFSEKDNVIKKIDVEFIQSNIQLQDSSDNVSFEKTAQISEKEQDIPVAEICEKLSSSIEESVIDKTKEQSSLLYMEQSITEMKDTEISSKPSDSVSIKSSEIVEQVDFKLVQELDDISSKPKYDSREKEQPSLSSVKLLNTEMKNIEALSQTTDSFSVKSSEPFVKCVDTTVSQAVKEDSSEETIQIIKTDSKSVEKMDAITSESMYSLSEKELSTEEKSDSLLLKLDTGTEQVIAQETTKLDLIDHTEYKGTMESYVKDKADVEDSSSSKITDDFETLDNFTDVPTYTETSDAYLDLDSDHSFEEIENLQIEAESPGLQEAQTADTPTLDTEASRETQYATEYYENSLPHKDILEGVDDFALDAIPENELENYEEEEYSLSEHFEINEDELIYPLPYNDDWIEQSFELKEYGVEAEFFESESDIHGLGIVHEDYDDEDIQRAIDYNLSTFEENEGDVEDVITTESFKTLSHDDSPHLKPDEYDTWSTADAPSIEEEFSEQDRVLSKIDEILAEDFGNLGIYEADSYLKHAEDTHDHLSKTFGDKCDDFIKSDKISLTKSDSETIQKVAKFDITHDETLQQKQSFEQILKTELDTEPEEISLKKKSTKAFESKYETVSSEIKVDAKPHYKTDSETSSAEITEQEDSSHIFKTLSDSIKNDSAEESKITALVEEESAKFDFISVQEIDSISIPDKSIQKDFAVLKTDTVSDTSTDKSAIKAFKTESTSLISEVAAEKDYVETFKIKSERMSSEISIKEYSKPEEKPASEIISEEINLKKASEKGSKIESDVASYEVTLDKVSTKESSIKSDSVSSEVIVKKDYAETLKTESELVSSKISIKREESKPDSESVSGEVTLKKPSEKGSKIESDVASYEVTLDKVSTKESSIKSDSVSSEVIVKKDYAETLKTESEVVSIKREESKPDSESVSDKVTLKKPSEKGSKAESDVASYEVTLDKVSMKESSIKSDSVSSEVIVKKDYAETLKTESEVVSSKISMGREESKSDSEIVCDQITLKKASEKGTKVESDVSSYQVTLDKDSMRESKIKPDSVSSEITVKKDSGEMFKTESVAVSSEISLKMRAASEVKTVSETVSDKLILEKSFEKDSKAELDATSKEVILEKDSKKEFKTKSDSVAKETVVEKDVEVTLKTKSEVMSGKLSIESDAKAEFKLDSDIISSEGFTKVSEKDFRTESDTISSEITLKKESVRETQFLSDSAFGEITIKKDIEETCKLKQDLTEEDRTLLKSTYKIPDEKQTSSIKEISSDQIKKSAESSIETKDISFSADASTHIISSSTDSHKDQKDVATLSISKTDSSIDIPLIKSEEKQNELSTSCETSLESEVTEFSQSSLLSESLKHSIKSDSESTEIQLNIPKQSIHKDETSDVTNVTDAISKEQTSSDSLVIEVKPDIPKKTKQKSLDLTDTSPVKGDSDKKPSLPPKKSKRHSLTDSSSSSFSESLSSSSSAESLGSFESAVSDKSRKSSLKSSDETSMHSLSPEVPTRRSRSSKSSSSRSTSKDSDDNSSCSRSSSLKIRRRSSNFAEPEPIDLSKKRASIDERMKKLQIEGKCNTKEKAFIAAKLIEMQFEEEDALLASKQCNTVYHAVKFLTQLCDMCSCRFPINLMSSLVNCTHRACKECLRAHFTSLLYDRSVFTLLCPICHKPDITDQNIQEYFTHLDMTLRNILEDKVYDLFQRKLRDEVLTKDPNFHWCSQCSSGFIASPRLKKLYCPDCSAITCAMCHQTWELEHEGVHCERFQQWKDMHTPEPPPAGLVKFLTDRGISCPSCGLVYAQACGGCMMYKCSHCNFEFCGFCIRPLKKGRECSNEICDSRGHHVHHLHNCLFFLRDKDITEIQMLLEEESVTYFTIPPKNQIVKTRCQVREQKINHGVIIEDRCGRPIEPYCGGLCRTHYYEYLAELLRKNKVSPLSIMTIQDLQFMLRKSRIFVPEKVKGETSEDYYERLLEFVTKNLT